MPRWHFCTAYAARKGEPQDVANDKNAKMKIISGGYYFTAIGCPYG